MKMELAGAREQIANLQETNSTQTTKMKSHQSEIHKFKTKNKKLSSKNKKLKKQSMDAKTENKSFKEVLEEFQNLQEAQHIKNLALETQFDLERKKYLAQIADLKNNKKQKRFKISQKCNLLQEENRKLLEKCAAYENILLQFENRIQKVDKLQRTVEVYMDLEDDSKNGSNVNTKSTLKSKEKSYKGELEIKIFNQLKKKRKKQQEDSQSLAIEGQPGASRNSQNMTEMKNETVQIIESDTDGKEQEMHIMMIEDLRFKLKILQTENENLKAALRDFTSKKIAKHGHGADYLLDPEDDIHLLKSYQTAKHTELTTPNLPSTPTHPSNKINFDIQNTRNHTTLPNKKEFPPSEHDKDMLAMENKTLRDKIDQYEADLSSLHTIFKKIKQEKELWSQEVKSLTKQLELKEQQLVAIGRNHCKEHQMPIGLM